jgi:hypothetical protein
MTRPEGLGEPEFILETDLSQDEGLPGERADVPLIPLDDSVFRPTDGRTEPQQGGGASDISFVFKGAGMLVGVRNRSPEDAATHRAMAASIPIVVAIIGAILLARFVPDFMNATVKTLIIVLMIVMGFYIGLRVIAEPVRRKPRKGKRGGKRKGN